MPLLLAQSANAYALLSLRKNGGLLVVYFRPSAQSICLTTLIKPVEDWKKSLDKGNRGIINRLIKSLWFATPAAPANSVRIGTETCSEWKEMFRTFQRKGKIIGPLLWNVFHPGFPQLPGLKLWQKQPDQDVHKWPSNVCCRWRDGRGGKDSINGRGTEEVSSWY